MGYMNDNEVVAYETPEEIAEYKTRYERKQDKEKDQTRVGKRVEITVWIPDVHPENVHFVTRDITRTLENCAKLHFLKEFAITRNVKSEEGKTEVMIK